MVKLISFIVLTHFFQFNELKIKETRLLTFLSQTINLVFFFFFGRYRRVDSDIMIFIFSHLPLSQHFFRFSGGVFDSMLLCSHRLTSSLKLPVCFKGVWLVLEKAKPCKRTNFQLQPKVFIFTPSLFHCSPLVICCFLPLQL